MNIVNKIGTYGAAAVIALLFVVSPLASTPAEAVTSACMNTIVKSGSTGECAKQAQAALLNAGFNPGTIDGLFYARSVQATKDFQAARGLKPVDGIIGRATWTALASSQTTPPPANNTKTGIGVGYNTKTGMERTVQERLKYHKDPRGRSYYVGVVDGSFGTGSMNGLLTFQRAWPGLAVTGTVDAATWAALVSNEQLYVTNGPGAIPAGTGIITSISQRTSWLVKGGKVAEQLDSRTAGWKPDKRTGVMRIHATPLGKYSIYDKQVSPSSAYFGDGAMPHSLIFHPDVYVHGSPLFDTQGYSGGSYACINLKTADAARVWPQVPVGGWVSIIR